MQKYFDYAISNTNHVHNIIKRINFTYKITFTDAA